MSLIKLKRDFASAVVRRPSDFFDLINQHARLNQWIKRHPAPVFGDRFELYDFVESTCLRGKPIDYLEFGVHEGASIRRWSEIHDNAESRFVGFDTFTGLPEDWGKYLGRGHFDKAGHAPAIDDARVSFVTGLFQDTLPDFLSGFAADRQLVIHNDSDLYSSTLYTLASLDRLLVPATIIIFDEFASPLHEFRAWNDYTGAFRRQYTLVGSSGPYAEQAAFLIN